MNAVGTGLVLIGNGLLSMATAVLSWQALVGAAAAGSAWWLARMEIGELDRMAVKPSVERH